MTHSNMKTKIKIYSQPQNNKGFTITEVVVSSFIFTLVIAGIYTAISVLKKPTVDSKQAMTAALLGKQVLGNLRTGLDAQTWNGAGGPLDPAGGPTSNGVYNNLTGVTVDGVTYTPSYVVTEEADTLARKVTLTITW